MRLSLIASLPDYPSRWTTAIVLKISIRDKTSPDARGRTVSVDPAKQMFDRAGIFNASAIPGKSGLWMKRRTHEIGADGSCTGDVVVDHARDAVVLGQVSTGKQRDLRDESGRPVFGPCRRCCIERWIRRRQFLVRRRFRCSISPVYAKTVSCFWMFAPIDRQTFGCFPATHRLLTSLQMPCDLLPGSSVSGCLSAFDMDVQPQRITKSGFRYACQWNAFWTIFHPSGVFRSVNTSDIRMPDPASFPVKL
jgi:hypothetical protein